MTYATLDYLPDLTATERAGAGKLTFTPYTAAGTSWDANAEVAGLDNNALLHSVYSFTAVAGHSYDFVSTSYFDPFLLRLYDNVGNTIVANNEADDMPDVRLDDGGSYSSDNIWGWKAPYSGTFYVDASWDQGSYYKFYYLGAYEDTGSSAPPTSSDPTMFGTIGAETINGTNGADTVIALDGNDSVFGNAGNDDVNGNVGNDMVLGGDGADWVRGGKGADTIFGDGGDDPHVNGNIGNDLVYGGSGNDTLYGGQDNDTIYGDAGNDLLSGDLGNDVLTGGAGADWFTITKGGGADWVADFNQAQGDRIQLAPGTAYTITSYQGQVVIDLGGGDSIGLVGVSSLSGDWLVAA